MKFLMYSNVQYTSGMDAGAVDSYTYCGDYNDVMWNPFGRNVYYVNTMDPADIGEKGAVKVMGKSVFSRGVG